MQSVNFRDRFDAHRLIEEFMVLANVAAAEELTRLRRPLLFRVHEEPSPEKLNALRDVAEASRYRCLSDQMTWLDEEEKEAVRAYLAAEDEPLEILGRYRFSLGEREIDLTEAIEGAPSAYPL